MLLSAALGASDGPRQLDEQFVLDHRRGMLLVELHFLRGRLLWQSHSPEGSGDAEGIFAGRAARTEGKKDDGDTVPHEIHVVARVVEVRSAG